MKRTLNDIFQDHYYIVRQSTAHMLQNISMTL